MSTFLPEEEYRKIKSSWRNGAPSAWKDWTNEQHLDACYVNVRDAAKRESQLRAFDRDWPIGDPRRNGDAETPSLRERIRAAASEQRHWREYVTYYRALCVAEYDAKPVVPTKLQQPDRRLPREPDEEEMPF